MNKELFEQTSTESPTRPGEQFAADVIQRSKQKIFATRDVHTSYTSATIISDQTADILRTAILDGTSLLRLPACVIRIDNAPGFLPLKHDSVLASHGITLEFGQVKNANRNPVAEKGNKELELELLRIDPTGSPVSQSTLQQALKNLNTRIRNRGLSSQEILFCRDQSTGAQLAVDDSVLSRQQQSTRDRNHDHSSRSKAKGAPAAQNARKTPGDLVYIKSEGDKNKARDMYLVTRIDVNSNMAFLQKLIGSTFQSRQYDVPLSRIFHAIEPGNGSLSSTTDSSSSSDEDDLVPAAAENISSDDEDDALLQRPSPPTRRSTRRRRSPAWLSREEWVRDNQRARR